MDCSTVSCYADEECQVISATRQKARKLHRCNECKRTIDFKEEYERFVGKDDNLFTIKTCSDCLSARDVFFNDGYFYTMVWEQLEEHIHECCGDISESKISELSPRAQRRVCDIIAECWEKYEDEDE